MDHSQRSQPRGVKEQNKSLYLAEKRTHLYTIIARDTGHDYDVFNATLKR
jgi:hypothetical protein